MQDKRAKVEVRVSKTGPSGQPLAEVIVNNDISANQLGSVLQKVVTSEQVLRHAGLIACGGCKSGLDIHIIGGFQELIQFEV